VLNLLFSIKDELIAVVLFFNNIDSLIKEEVFLPPANDFAGI